MLEWIIITILVLTIVGMIFFLNRLVKKISEREEENKTLVNENKELETYLSEAATKMEERIKEYERVVNDAARQLDNRDEYIAKFAETIYEVERKMKEIDSKELFVSDDEVGFVYRAINQEIQRLYNFAKREDEYGKEEKE